MSMIDQIKSQVGMISRSKNASKQKARTIEILKSRCAMKPSMRLNASRLRKRPNALKHPIPTHRATPWSEREAISHHQMRRSGSESKSPPKPIRPTIYPV